MQLIDVGWEERILEKNRGGIHDLGERTVWKVQRSGGGRCTGFNDGRNSNQKQEISTES